MRAAVTVAFPSQWAGRPAVPMAAMTTAVQWALQGNWQPCGTGFIIRQAPSNSDFQSIVSPPATLPTSLEQSSSNITTGRINNRSAAFQDEVSHQYNRGSPLWACCCCITAKRRCLYPRFQTTTNIPRTAPATKRSRSPYSSPKGKPNTSNPARNVDIGSSLTHSTDI